MICNERVIKWDGPTIDTYYCEGREKSNNEESDVGWEEDKCIGGKAVV